MTFRVSHRRHLAASAALAALCAAAAAQATTFDITNIVSDGSVPAIHIDPTLVNAWGISYGPTGPFWISSNGKGATNVYDGSGHTVLAPITIPVPPGGAPPSKPTGQVFNATAGDFKVSLPNGGPSAKPFFLFDTEDGTISGWAPSLDPAHALVAVDNSAAGAIYKGLALGSTGAGNFLYAANFHSGLVEMYDKNFGLAGTFTDPSLGAGFAPFNVQALNGHLYVAFAMQDAAREDEVAGAGLGYVDEFNFDGSFSRRIASLGGALNAPWGLAIAPSTFGEFAGDLLVGNFGDGTISAFDISGAPIFEGALRDRNGHVISEDGLWALIPGNNGLAGSSGNIYFTAGPGDENHGLFGSLSAAPEPGTWTLMLLGFGLLGAALRNRRALAA